MATEELLFDAWTPLAFKRSLGGKRQATAGFGWTAPSWVGDNQRRLQAYTLLRAYTDNAAREFFVSADRNKIEERREYGDAALVVNTIMAALLGDEQTLTVDGASDWDPNRKEASSDIADKGDAQAAWELQAWLRDWADDERLGLKMVECERRVVGLGDGVYTLGWSTAKGRPRLRVWDPGFYFPVLTDGNEDDYPEKVHIAWELAESDTLGANQVQIRRITWWLAPIAAPGTSIGFSGPDEIFAEQWEGDVVVEESDVVQRQLPWNDEPTNITCYMTDATWTLDTSRSSINDLKQSDATPTVDEDGPIVARDLGIDFLPVIHLPNTVSLLEHFGRSSISTVLQILDDLASADTDVQAASATTGKPMLALQGATMGGKSPRYEPGAIFETGDGKMGVLDTSKALDALLKYVDSLLSRLSTSGRVPEAVMGRVDASDVPSGVALALSFGPLETMVKEMRLVRAEKYPLLLKFVHRIALANDMPDAPPADKFKGDIAFGSYLPQDQAAAVDAIVKLTSATLARPGVSLETAVQMLMEAGLPITDVVEEIQRIQSRDFKGADDLMTATQDETAVFDYLGRDQPPEPPAPPAPVVPPGTVVDPATGQPVVTPPVPAPVPAPTPPAPTN